MNVWFALVMSLGAGCATAPALDRGLPEAAFRTFSVNYKDMMLAGCIARAYKAAPEVNKDAHFSVSAFNEWTRYDAENAAGVNVQIIDR